MQCSTRYLVMTRLLSLLALLGSLAAAGWSIAAIVTVLEAPAPEVPVVVSVEPTVNATPAKEASRPFLAIFGTPAVPEVPEPEVARPPVSFDFVLKGVIAVGDVRWAILSKDGADVVVREGETLEGGVEVVTVLAEEIELVTPNGAVTLGFKSETPVTMAEIRPSETARDRAGPKGNFVPDAPAAVLFQDMSSDEILAALEQAEEERVSRGWVTASD